MFSKLRPMCDYVDVDAVLISHLHADHFLDLVPFSYALCYAPRQQPVPVGGWPGHRRTRRARSCTCPSGRHRGVPQASSAAGGNEDLIDNAFDMHEYRARRRARRSDRCAVRFCEVPHFTVTYAIELTEQRLRFTFSADCSPNEQLVRFARDTDLLLIEATLPRPERTGIRAT